MLPCNIASMIPAMGDDRAQWLSDEEQKIWRSYLFATAHVNHVIDADLRKDGLDIAEYNILVNLSEAPEHKLRMSQLADDVVHSRSRLTHTVSRLEQRGLVVREACQDDGRGILARLTPAGLEKLDETAPNHVATVRRVLVDTMSKDEFRALGRAMAAIMAAVEE